MVVHTLSGIPCNGGNYRELFPAMEGIPDKL